MNQQIMIVYSAMHLIILALPSTCISAESVEFPGSVLVANMDSKPSTIIQLNCLSGGTKNQATCYIGRVNIFGNANPKQEEDIKEVTEQEKQKAVAWTKETICAENAIEKVRHALEANPSLLQSSKTMELFCKNPTFDTLMKFTKANKKHNNQSCSIHIYPQVNKVFTYNAETEHWVSKVGPSGMCGAISTTEMYLNKEAGWVYTTLGVVTNEDAREACAVAYDGKLYKYRSVSTDARKYYKLNCTYIKF